MRNYEIKVVRNTSATGGESFDNGQANGIRARLLGGRWLVAKTLIVYFLFPGSAVIVTPTIAAIRAKRAEYEAKGLDEVAAYRASRRFYLLDEGV